MIRVYGVVKKNGKWDVLNRNNIIPKTVEKVLVAWGDGKGENHAEMDRELFLSKYTFVQGCNWKLI